MEKPTLQEIVERWLADNDGRIKGDIATRVFLFFNLFEALEEYGYTKDDVQASKRYIKDMCYCDYGKTTSAQKAKWKSMIEASYNRAAVTYPRWQFQMPTYDPEKTAIQKTEYAPIPDSFKAEIKAAILSDRTNEASDGFVEDNNEEYEDAPIREYKTYSDEEWAKVPPLPEPLYDEDLLILLGFKK